MSRFLISMSLACKFLEAIYNNEHFLEIETLGPLEAIP